ncbi:hypothetical protein RJ640_027035 [Escallonia rubra]|uniref:SUF system FeS cluster assembly SufBD core domain-containing protein n=1 Tax=Escallonia rubra TaxID=112253 RepID=A0AA88QBP9_9ASTE|nr:hypothetical protein RJ640_027035 [Escallonia rubra]
MTSTSCLSALLYTQIERPSDHRGYAQQTDAGQLTRSRLLEPRASVNVKPNLPIIADDVKCSHGAAISDLEESQLFYFRGHTNGLEKL